jgi:hypothetical protein
LGEQQQRLADEYLRLKEESHLLVVVSQTSEEVHRINHRVGGSTLADAPVSSAR